MLREFNLRIRAGETIAIVGENGCGKSTLAKLLLRFYDPQAGCIRMDGVDLRKLSVHDLRCRIAIVPQKATLFDDSVANNIRFGCPDAVMARVVDAAKRAHADHFISETLRRAIRHASATTGKSSPAGNASGLHWPGQFCAIRDS